MTTWALVRISPSSEMTKPEPWPPPPPPPPKTARVRLSPKTEITVTTPGADGLVDRAARRRRRPRPRSRPAASRRPRWSWSADAAVTVVVSPSSSRSRRASAATRPAATQRGERPRDRAHLHALAAGRRELELGAPAAERSVERAAHPQRELAGDRQAEAGAGDLVAGVEALEDALARRAGRCPGRRR